MANPRYAPEFRLLIDDAPAPAALRASVTSVSLQTGLEGADRVEVTLANDHLRWLDHPLLALDHRLALWMGYAPDPLDQLFAGEITGQTAAFPSSGVPTLTVAAQDRRRRLQQGTKVRWFAIPTPLGNIAIPDPAVASIVSAENGLMPIVDPVGATLALVLGGIEAVSSAGDPDAQQRCIRKQDQESDFDFLGRICKECGWEMLIEHGGPLGGHQLRFTSPGDHLAPDLTLKYGQSLLEFTPRISNVGQLVSITAFIWLAPLKTTLSVTVGWDWDRMSLSIDIRPSFTPMGQGASDYLIEEPVTLVSAPRKIISELIPKLNGRLTGSGSTVGDPRIRAGSVIRLEGLGVQFGGLYRVTSATHTMDGGGYRTAFEARKEIWFGSIPLPEQGALPLRVSAPGLS